MTHPARRFLSVALAITGIALASICYRQQGRINVLESQRATILRELRGKAWGLQRIKDIRPELDELRFVAEVFRGRERYAYRASKAAWKWGKHYRISPYLIVSVIHRESNFNPMAVSSVGAVGLMQVMPRVWKLSPEKLTEIDFNVEHGTRILKHYIDRHGDVGRSLFHYWGGDNDRHGYGYPASVLGSRYFNHGG